MFPLFLSSSAEPQNRPQSASSPGRGWEPCRVPNRSTQGLTTTHRLSFVTLRLVDTFPHHFLQRTACLCDGLSWETQAAAGCSSGCCSAASFRHGASAWSLPGGGSGEPVTAGPHPGKHSLNSCRAGRWAGYWASTDLAARRSKPGNCIPPAESVLGHSKRWHCSFDRIVHQELACGTSFVKFGHRIFLAFRVPSR